MAGETYCVFLNSITFAAQCSSNTTEALISVNSLKSYLQLNIHSTVIIHKHTFQHQDKTWTYWFIRRVGNVCDGPLGNVFTVLSVGAGACFAGKLLEM